MSSIAQRDTVRVAHITDEIKISSLDDERWQKAHEVAVTTYWSGEKAPKTRQFKARLIWSPTALYVRFEAEQHEPLIVSEKPDLSKKVMGLWDRDVCEIFIAPNKTERNKYYEFEIAPTGEWIDLGIEVTAKKRLTDEDYASGMTSSARIDKDKIVMAIKLPFSALGKHPKAGNIWLGNLFRCVGKDPTRGYLAWRPTRSKQPAFHHPEAFGQFVFEE
ncbi:MAG: carbohydrate-binding family 9-like protein [Acidobacteria bacterium]|nr:carbohydrate-binding family 9-like protein [Acidobacteriota bacterium]